MAPDRKRPLSYPERILHTKRPDLKGFTAFKSLRQPRGNPSRLSYRPGCCLGAVVVVCSIHVSRDSLLQRLSTKMEGAWTHVVVWKRYVRVWTTRVRLEGGVLVDLQLLCSQPHAETRHKLANQRYSGCRFPFVTTSQFID